MLILVFVGGVYYFGGVSAGGDVVGLILLTCLIVFLTGVFHAKT
jgi:hypothetical protein